MRGGGASGVNRRPTARPQGKPLPPSRRAWRSGRGGSGHREGVGGGDLPPRCRPLDASFCVLPACQAPLGACGPSLAPAHLRRLESQTAPSAVQLACLWNPPEPRRVVVPLAVGELPGPPRHGCPAEKALPAPRRKLVWIGPDRCPFGELAAGNWSPTVDHHRAQRPFRRAVPTPLALPGFDPVRARRRHSAAAVALSRPRRP